MKANQWMGKRNMQVNQVPDPVLLNGSDCIVKITSTAICGSDLHLYNGFMPTMEKGDIMGHEFMGEVVEVGNKVEKLKVGDRVVVPFPIACGRCNTCRSGQFALCENSNPNAFLAEQMLGHPTAGIFGYSHLTGGYAGGQTEYARVPFADVGPIKVPLELSDDQALFLSDILPTGYMAAEMCNISPGDVIAVWGCGPVGQLAIASARMLGAERVIAIDRFPYRLAMARDRAGATDVLNYEEVKIKEALAELTGGRGPDACIDAVGLEAHGVGPFGAYDKAKQMLRMEMDRPTAIRECIMNCKNGGIVSVVGVYASFVDKFPLGQLMNRGLTIRTGQCHVHRYMRPLLDAIMKGQLDPSFIITHKLKLDEAPQGYKIFVEKEDSCMKVVLKN